jgi:hypothetical protein
VAVGPLPRGNRLDINYPKREPLIRSDYVRSGSF